MRSILRTIFGVTALALGAVQAHAEIEFVGIVAMPHKTMFALSDTASEKTNWVAIGQNFSGYTVKSYHADAETIVLTKSGADLSIHLKNDAKIQSARLELIGTVTLGEGEKVEISRATLLFDQENIFPMKDGVTYRITPHRRTDGTILYRITVDRQLAENKHERISSPAVVTLPGQSFALHIGEVGFAFNPRTP